jgi:hypothetical protein
MNKTDNYLDKHRNVILTSKNKFETFLVLISALLIVSVDSWRMLDHFGYEDSQFYTYPLSLINYVLLSAYSSHRSKYLGKNKFILKTCKNCALYFLMVLGLSFFILFSSYNGKLDSAVYMSLFIVTLFLPLLFFSQKFSAYFLSYLKDICIYAIVISLVMTWAIVFFNPGFFLSVQFNSRLPGIMLSPNVFAIYGLFGILLLFYRRVFFKNEKQFSRLTELALFLLFLLSIYYSFSKTVILILILTTFISLIYFLINKKTFIRAFLIAFSFFIGIFVFFEYSLIDASYIVNRFSRNEFLIDSARLNTWISVYNEIDRSDLFELLFGHGVGSFSSQFEHSAHNQVIKDLWDLGISYITLLFVMLFLIVYEYLKNHQFIIRIRTLILFLFLFSLFLYSMTYTPFASFNTINLVYYISVLFFFSTLRVRSV